MWASAQKHESCHTFCLVIFLTIFPKLVLIYIEWKIANSAETKTEALFKKKKKKKKNKKNSTP